MARRGTVRRTRQRVAAAVASSKTEPIRSWSALFEPTSSDASNRVTQYGADIASFWFHAVSRMMGNVSRAASPGSTSPAAADRPVTGSRRASPAQLPRLSVDLQATQPTEVALTLEGDTDGPLVVEPLRARAGAASKVDVSLDLERGRAGDIRLRVHVPPRTPPGRYSGAILDSRTKEPRGRVTLKVAG
jgi:hypothetical protein